jgi:hypothetical protein
MGGEGAVSQVEFRSTATSGVTGRYGTTGHGGLRPGITG